MTLVRSVSGIRGLVGEDLYPENIAKFASTFGDFINSGTVICGTDTRKSGKTFSGIFSNTLNYKGINVIHIGIVPTPTVLFLVNKMKLKGGFIITASHNPPQYNGLKFVNSKGRFLNKKDYEKFIYLEKHPIKKFKKQGKTLTDTTLYKEHIKAVLQYPLINKNKIKKKKLKIVFDCASGGGAIVIPELLKQLNVELITINSNIDGNFYRNPEPIPINLKRLQQKVRQEKGDLGLATDGDGDRIAIVTPNRGTISEEYTIGLIGNYVLQKTNKNKIVINQSSSILLETLGKKHNYKVYRSPVGEANVVEEIIKRKSIIGGEGNGGVILPEINKTRDALIASALLIQMLTDNNKDIDSILDEFPEVNIIKKKYPLKDKKIFTKIKKKFSKYNIDKTDGLRIMFDDGFIHIRPSGTEPIIRLIAEFTSKEKTLEMINKTEELIN